MVIVYSLLWNSYFLDNFEDNSGPLLATVPAPDVLTNLSARA